MVKKPLVTALLAGIVVASIAVSGSTHTYDPLGCGGDVTSIPNEQSGVIHVDNDLPGSIWIYLETNNHAGLQRGGESILIPDIDVDTCDTTHGSGSGRNPDTLIL